MTQKFPPKGVILSDLIAIFVMSFEKQPEAAQAAQHADCKPLVNKSIFFLF
ncbi:MAG: hypothetical protein ACI4CA_02575 [Bacteroides sp.]